MSQYVKYLVCYDIPDNRTRARFASKLKDLGLIPLQKSVFYGDLKPAESKALSKIAKDMLDDDEDYCFWFPCHLNFTDMRSCIGYKNFKYDEPDGHGFI